jgi:thiamine-phosphate diphosphorylase
MDTPRFRAPLRNSRLYLLATTSATDLPLAAAVEAAIRGGVDLVQLREKDLDDDAMTHVARAVLVVCRAHRVPFLVNDRIGVARAVEADGVHLGQDDASVAEARAELPAGSIVGVSTHDADELERALHDGADYVGVGALYPTATKSTPVPVRGPVAVAALARIAELRGVPAFGIGGVTQELIDEIAAAGLARAAACRGILATDQPERVAREMRAALVRTSITPPASTTSSDAR